MSVLGEAILLRIEWLASRGPRPKRPVPAPASLPDDGPLGASVRSSQNEARRAARAARVTPLEELFWAGVEKTETCWVWAGELHESGYGRARWLGRRMQAHRIAWALSRGDLPDGRRIAHTCGNRACVRPDHLVDSAQRRN